MSTIELLQKKQRKQAEFEAEERTKKATRREEEHRQKLKVKAAVVTGTHHFGIFFLVGRGIELVQSSGRK